MSDHISWVLQVSIHPGKLDDFRAVAADLVAATTSEPGSLDYEWSLNDDGTVAHIFERYQNSEALLAHLQTFGPYASRFLAACQPAHFHIYGTPSSEAKSALADLGPVYFAPLGGFSR